MIKLFFFLDSKNFGEKNSLSITKHRMVRVRRTGKLYVTHSCGAEWSETLHWTDEKLRSVAAMKRRADGLTIDKPPMQSRYEQQQVCLVVECVSLWATMNFKINSSIFLFYLTSSFHLGQEQLFKHFTAYPTCLWMCM